MRPPETSVDRWSPDFWCPVLFFVVCVLACVKLNPWDAPILLDDQVYFYISERAASGIPPHISEFDPKNALSMFVNAAFIWTGRHLGIDDLMAARAASILAVGLSSAFVWTAARRIGGSRAIAHAAALFPLVFVDFLALAVAGAQPKIFLALALALWLLTATTKRPFLLAVTSICCFLVWQPALMMVAISAVAMLLAGEVSVRSTARFAAGVAVPLVLYELYFWWHGALDEQIYQSLLFAAQYKKPMPSFAGTFQRVFGLGGDRALREVELRIFAAALSGLPFAAVIFRQRAWEWIRGRSDRICLVLSAYGTTAFCFVDYQGFPDRFFILPPMAIVCGIVVGSLFSFVAARMRRWTGNAGWLRFAVRAVPAVIVALLLARIPDRTFDRLTLAEQRAGAAHVGKLIRSGRTVYAMSPLHILAMNRESNFSYYGFFPSRIRAYLSARVKKEGQLIPLKDGKLPDVLLQSRFDFPPNKRWIDKYYRRGRSPLLKKQNVAIYMLRDDVKKPPKNARSL